MARDFDVAAKTWDQNEERRRMALSVARAMRDALNLRGTETLLDYGTGTGLVALELAPHVQTVLAADSSRAMLEVFDEKLAAEGQARVRTRLLDLVQEPTPANLPPLDVLVSSMTLHHVADTLGIARRFYDALAPGGKIALADLDTEAGDFHDDPTGVAHFGFDRAALAGTFTEAGFVSVTTRTAYTMQKKTAKGDVKAFTIVLLTGLRPA